MDWQHLNLNAIPDCAGVYGWQHQEKWLYIGQAQSISKRLNTQHQPLRIALSIELEIHYWYMLCEAPVRLERQLHRKLQPSWCGGLDIYAKYPKYPSCLLVQELVTMCQVEDAIFNL